MLTGSDSAPAKANEAKQKNEIGSAKDEVSMFVQNELTDAYEDVYVNGAAGGASARIGNAVITAVNGKYGTALPHGNAHIQAKTNTTTGNGEVTIWTTDFKIIGTIDKNGGILSWGELTANDGSTPVSQTPTKTLSSIAITTEPTKTSYNVGETLNLAGIVVTATYSDNTTSPVTATYSPENGTTLNTEGATTITASYTEGGVTKTATTSVTVVEDTGGDPTAANSVRSLARAGTIEVGDYVNYNPGNATSDDITLPTGASIVETISAADAKEWQVLKVDQTTGEVVLLATTPDSLGDLTLNLNGNNSSNIISAINMVAGIYKNDEYAKNVRSIKIEDFELLDGNGEVPTLSYEDDKLIYSNSYYWCVDTYVVSGCWVDNLVYDTEHSCDAILTIGDADVICVNSSSSLRVYPLITLKSGIQMERNGDGVWQLSRGTQ